MTKMISLSDAWAFVKTDNKESLLSRIISTYNNGSKRALDKNLYLLQIFINVLIEESKNGKIDLMLVEEKSNGNTHKISNISDKNAAQASEIVLAYGYKKENGIFSLN